jgi:RHS repeat-associated protein
VLSDDRTVVLATYTYGDSNERLIAEEGGGRTYYVAGGSGVVMEYSEALSSTQPQWSKSYVYLGARLLSVITPDGGGGEYVEYHHPDRLGTRLISNSSDPSVQGQSTLPYGTVLTAETSAATTRRFTSYDRSSATGLDYAVNRHYDPQQGRFTQVDPLEMNAANLTNPQSLNLYAYCGNDPINNIDPDGLFWGKLFHFLGKLFKWVGVALAVAVIVVTAAIIFTPASSFLFKAALWSLTHVLIPISHLPVLGAMVPLYGLSSPPWNPTSRSVFGSSWQDPSNPDGLPPCSQPNVLPCVATDVVKTNTGASPWPAWWDRALDTGVTFFAGMANTQTGGYYKLAGRKLARVFAWGLGGDPNRAEELTEQDYQQRERSYWYTAGEVTGVVTDVAEGAEAAIAASRAAGWGGKLAVHTAHHQFGSLGRLSHLQANVWKMGVKGSGKVFRIPLPLRKWPTKEIIIKRW